MQPPAFPDPLARALVAPRPPPPLAGLRVLLVTHGYWFIYEMVGLLREAGAEVAGPAGRLVTAWALTACKLHMAGP